MKEKIILGAIGALVLLQVANTVKMSDTLEQVKIVRGEIEEIKSEIKDVSTETKDLKEEITVLRAEIYTSEQVKLTEQEKQCLARNIFFEAGVEDIKGKLAVAQVTYNRLKTKRWGKSLCDVVYAKKQFSWTLDKNKRYSSPKGKLWKESLEAKRLFLEGKRIKGLEGSLHYHTDYINTPKWAKKMPVAMQVGQHIFYNM